MLIVGLEEDEDVRTTMYGLLSEKENVSVCFVCLRAPRWIELELVAIASSPASSFPLSSTDDESSARFLLLSLLHRLKFVSSIGERNEEPWQNCAFCCASLQ